MDPKLEALLTAANDACIVIEVLAQGALESGDTQSAHWAQHRSAALGQAVSEMTWHSIAQMTDDQVRAELIEHGLDPDDDSPAERLRELLAKNPRSSIRDTPDFPEDPEESPFSEPPSGPETSRQRIFQDIEAERAAQDAKWGGPTHDDEHDVLDWVTYIGKHARRAAVVDPAQQRKQMIRVAALAVACVEALDRQGHGQPRELTTEEARDLARHFASRTRNGGPIELTADEREALFAWVRHRMEAEDSKVQEAKAEIDARRAAKGLPPTSRPSATRESKVLAIAIELDLAPWDTKPVLDDDDLAVARALCDAAEGQ